MATDRSATLAMLRARVARLEGTAASRDHGCVSITDEVDQVLPDGGLARGAVHEVAPARGEEGKGPAFAFSSLLAGRVEGTTVWIEPTPSLWPPGAVAFGLEPASLVLVAAEGTDSLWAAEEALRCPAVGTCVLVGVIPDLVASRRLQLAAEAGGVLGLAIVPERSLANASAARTRWRIAASPGAGRTDYALGDPCWRLELTAGKGCQPGSWNLRWDPQAHRLLPRGTMDDIALRHLTP
jgi:protein ImuA